VIARIDSVRQVKGKPFSIEQRYYNRFAQPGAGGSGRSGSLALGY
jgi:hypothetical protein